MTQKPRILILSTSYLPLIGGSELAIRHIAERLPEYDFDLVTRRFSRADPNVQQMDRIRVFRVRSPKILLPVAIVVRALILMVRHRYALMHAYQASHAGGAAWVLTMVYPGVPFLLTLQEGKDLDRQPWLVRFFRRCIIRRADRITAISSYLDDYAKRYSHAPVDVIPNGVVIRDIRHAPQNPDPTILTVSRLVPKNNVEGLIRALPLVRKTVTNARLAIVGDGYLRADLERLAEKLGIREVVGFLGTVPHDELPPVYALADVFVRPSLSEGLGNVFFEAMASEVPVIGSAVGGIPDFLHAGETGLVCDPRDPEDIARTIVRALTDEALRERVVRNAAALVRARYDWNIIASKMGEVYKEMSQ